MRTSSITPIPMEAIDFATRSDETNPYRVLVFGFLVLTMLVIVSGLLGAL